MSGTVVLFLGRPRGRSVDSKLNSRTAVAIHASSPNGFPRVTPAPDRGHFGLRLRSVHVIDPSRACAGTGQAASKLRSSAEFRSQRYRLPTATVLPFASRFRGVHFVPRIAPRCTDDRPPEWETILTRPWQTCPVPPECRWTCQRCVCGQRQPADEPRQFSVLRAAKRPSARVRHDKEPKAAFGSSRRLRRRALSNAVVIFIVLEDPHPRIGSIEHVINVSSFGGSVRSSHPLTVANTRPFVNIGS